MLRGISQCSATDKKMNGIRRNIFSKLIFYINFKGIFKKNRKAIRFRHLCFKSSTDTAIQGWIELLQSCINKLIKDHANPSNMTFFFSHAPNGFWTHSHTLQDSTPSYWRSKRHLSQSSHMQKHKAYLHSCISKKKKTMCLICPIMPSM